MVLEIEFFRLIDERAPTATVLAFLDAYPDIPQPRDLLYATHLASNLEVLQRLLALVHPAWRDEYSGETVLHEAARQGLIEWIECLLTDGRVDPATPNTWNKTAIHVAMQYDRAAVVERLLHDERVQTSGPMLYQYWKMHGTEAILALKSQFR